MSSAVTPIVFLHVPKTAGQTIHNELARMVGAAAVSPVRVHTQALKGPQMPPGFALYSGHLDWAEIDTMPDRFVFTVLRDPAERIASFYFFLLDEAQRLTDDQLALPGNQGKAFILRSSTEDYLFGGPPAVQRFIRDHYDNFYCSYFATRKMRGWGEVKGLAAQDRIAAALTGLERLDSIYSTSDLAALERDIALRYGATIRIVENYHNTGSHEAKEARWPKLLARIGSDSARRRLEDFVAIDAQLMDRVRFSAD